MSGLLRHRWRTWSAAVVGGVAVALIASQALLGAGASAAPGAPAAASHSVKPRSVGNLDCNGYSTIQKSVSDRKLVCTDIRGLERDAAEYHHRFYDNGHYIGHDEPSIRFLSSRPGSGNDVTFTERLPLDPKRLPTVNHPGRDVTHWFELSPAPWYGMSICDPNSYPQTPCTPNSDSNAPHGSFPGGGGAFMEMQFYPPGEAPFRDNISCDNTHWCAALNIDSLEARANGQMQNGCVEPVNFAFIQRNGVPAGPPSPQLSDLATLTPNSQTLLMNPGDVVRTRMFDANLGGGQHAFEVKISDLTTGQSGFMIASAANGFMNTSIFNCSGTPFNFQPLFNTARAANSIGWSVLLSGILSEYEIGHFIPCSSFSGPPITLTGAFTDTSGRFCDGAYENAGPPDTGTTSQELSDALCYPKGDTHGGVSPPNEVTGCEDNFTQNGDLDFDGTPYYADYPDSLNPGPFPSPILQLQPRTDGHRYANLQFETDAPASEFVTCQPGSESGCRVPPPNSPGNFYPYWTQAMVGGQCVWEFGNMTNGNTFGKDRQYAHLVAHGFFKGQFDLASRVRDNPNC
jgi:hypothetical protein